MVNSCLNLKLVSSKVLLCTFNRLAVSFADSSSSVRAIQCVFPFGCHGLVTGLTNKQAQLIVEFSS
ncbi:hypothetical protein BTO08_17300 [Photobacterium angustum]|uniref:Uncharacterized protein n=1 Tax=Photobacterium angustum TaxID=661 RepID=A0A2S7VJT2_PHOAN|nr:hypothetical protein BTO08_17300 [Photobacterium angustum]